MANLHDIVQWCNQTLKANEFKDYAPNGLQIEGKSKVNKIVCAVTASEDAIDAAIAQQADALLVHHGYFWKGEDGRITGIRRQRLGVLIENDINLLAYHLPLDAHPELGNNAQLARRLGWQVTGRFGEQAIGWLGELAEPADLGLVAVDVANGLGRTPLVIGDMARPIRRIAWCSGGAQGYFEQAIALGVDAYLSGEISEQTVHLARESGVAYIAAGHHATERGGVQALAGHLARQFDLDCSFVDIDNPV